MNHPPPQWLRAAGLALGASALAAPATLSLACGPTEGEVAMDRECPADEVCSDLAPRGLSFASDQTCGLLTGRDVAPTLLGGTQEITVIRGSAELDVPFRAVSSDESVFTVEGVAPPTVRVAGVAEGGALLRILETDDDLLLDRVQLRVVGDPDPRLRLSLMNFPLVADWEGLTGTTDLAFAMYPNGRGRLLVDLGNGAVDDSATVTPSTGEGLWCWPEIQAGATDFDVTLTAGGETFTLPVVVSDTVVQLAATAQGGRTDLPPWAISQEMLLCVVGLSDTEVIVGVPVTATATGAVTVSPSVEGAGCFDVTPSGVGEGEVVVEGAGLSATFGYEVSAALRGEPATEAEPGRLGERAAALAD